MAFFQTTILLCCFYCCSGMSFTWLSPKPDTQSQGNEVSFLVRLDYEKVIPTTRNVIFDYLDRNVGNGFNMVDSSFTAPVTGTYIFNLMLQNADKFGFSDYCLIKRSFNSQSFLSCTTLTMPFDQKSITILVPLKFGEGIVVTKTFDSGHNASLRGGRNWSSFQGELLKPEVPLHKT